MRRRAPLAGGAARREVALRGAGGAMAGPGRHDAGGHHQGGVSRGAPDSLRGQLDHGTGTTPQTTNHRRTTGSVLVQSPELSPLLPGTLSHSSLAIRRTEIL